MPSSGATAQIARRALANAEVPALVERLRLRNEFDPGDGHPDEAVAFLRRIDAMPAAIADEHLLHADAIVHVASRTAAPVDEFCAELSRLLTSAAGSATASASASTSASASPITLSIHRGVVRPTIYTGGAMQNFAYAHQVVQQPGAAAPHAFLLPMSKTAAWWEKDWMERHTYILPRYDETGRMVAKGHALAAAPGIPHLMRRTYKHPTLPAPSGAYDFLTYFECAEAHVTTFHEVCRNLRDVAANPEWKYVREGPTWHGRRVATWRELFA